MKLKLMEHIWIIIFPLNKQKKKYPVKFWYQIFYGEILNFFAYFSRKIAIFSFRQALWRHNYVTAEPILFILVFINRRDQYLSNYTK